MFTFLQTGAVFKNDREGLLALAALLLYLILVAQHSLLVAQWDSQNDSKGAGSAAPATPNVSSTIAWEARVLILAFRTP